MYKEKPSTVILIVLDGFGIAPEKDFPGDATKLAKMPNYHKFVLNYPQTHLQASGKAVGLPAGQDGSSQVGHLNLGAGRIVYQDLLRINQAISDGTFYRNDAFIKAFEHIHHHNSNLHLFGIIQPSAVHGSLDHLFTLLWMAKEYDVKNVYLHLFTDGRDDPPKDGINTLSEVENRLHELGVGQIATISGRFYAMDRDNRWDRTEATYNCMVLGEGEKAASAREAILRSYDNNITDEFIKPTNIVDQSGNPIGLVKDGDSIIFFNHRVDRVRQLTKAFILPSFEYVLVPKFIFNEKMPLEKRKQVHKVKTFERRKFLNDLCFVTMTRYEEGLPVAGIAFPRNIIKETLAEILANHEKRQLHIAETEKERFVTYYFNGMREDPLQGEERVIIPSPPVTTYDQKPEMSSFELTSVLIPKIQQRSYDFIVVNFANPDMVAHTGNLEAGIKACEAIDQCLGKLIPAVLSVDGYAIITADHGNVEEMLNNRDGGVDTEHSNFPVPFICISKNPTNLKTLQPGILADVAPTILSLMGIPVPPLMTGRNLLR